MLRRVLKLQDVLKCQYQNLKYKITKAWALA
jgi:hypothetical protein